MPTAILIFAASLAAAPAADAPPAAPAASVSPAGERRPGADAPDGVGGPIERVRFDIPAILIEGRKPQDDRRWTGAVDPALERRYGPREPARYDQITIPF